MKSYNGTCFVSHLPINENDEVALFIIKKEKSSFWNGYIPLNCENLGIPIYCKYNCSNVFFDFQYPKIFEDYILSLKLYMRNRNDKFEQVKAVSLADFVLKICSFGFYCTLNEYGNEEYYSTVMIHKELYEKLLSEIKTRTVPKSLFICDDYSYQITEGFYTKWTQECLKNAMKKDKDENIIFNSQYAPCSKFFANKIASGEAPKDKTLKMLSDAFIWEKTVSLLRLNYNGTSLKSFDNEQYLHQIVAEFIFNRCTHVKEQVCFK